MKILHLLKKDSLRGRGPYVCIYIYLVVCVCMRARGCVFVYDKRQGKFDVFCHFDAIHLKGGIEDPPLRHEHCGVGLIRITIQ